jgi:hypothetical protein
MYGWRGETQIPQDNLGRNCRLDTDKHVCLCNLDIRRSKGGSLIPGSVPRSVVLIQEDTKFVSANGAWRYTVSAGGSRIVVKQNRG